MIIETLTLTNFRQFRGKHTLRFAHGRKNVTVVFGENGRGKTGLYRALMFCLYGDRQLSQDGTAIEEHEVHLVNTAAVQETRENKNKPVDASVELVFTHADHRYTLRRCLQSMCDGGDTFEEPTELSLRLEKPGGNCQVIRDAEEIGDHIRAIIDPRVREYFLFDGEKIENLTRASQHQRKEVSRGVRSLLNIDAIEMAIRALKRLAKELGKEIEKTATGELARVMKELNAATAERDESEEQITRLEEEIDTAEHEKEDLDKKLKKHRGIRELVDRRETLDEQITQIEYEMRELRAALRDHIGRSAMLLALDAVTKVFTHIDKRRRKGELPPEIRRDFIEKLLADATCICGRAIHERSEEYSKLQTWLRKVSDPDLGDSALELWRLLDRITSQEATLRQDTETTLQTYGHKNNELEKARRQLENVNQKIGEDVRADAVHWEKQRKEVESDIRRRSVDKQRLEERCTDLASAIQQKEARKTQLQKEQGLQDELSSRHSLVEATLSMLTNVAMEFTREARSTIAEEASRLFHTFLDQESQGLFDAIIVNDDYSLQILDRHHNPTLANISAGQRQLMSIAFIAALAKTAAGGRLLERPLFMDTPFGRLSLDHRLSLINNVPGLCAQWILLATDTELRRAEATYLRDSKKWGRFYRLVASPEGETTVKEQSVDDALLILREEEESEA